MISEHSKFTSNIPRLAGKEYKTIQEAQEAEQTASICESIEKAFAVRGELSVEDLPQIIRMILNYYKEK